MMAAVESPGLLPETQGVQFTARPALRTRDSISRINKNGRSSSLGSNSDIGVQPVNTNLSSIEVEALLREKVRAKHQNISQVDKNPNGTIRYGDFLDKFYGHTSPAPAGNHWNAGQNQIRPPSAAREINVDMIEKLIKDKISTNFKAVVKALQLFDYNRDGKIQRHELRRVLENYCFKLSDDQYQKLWMRYDFHHTGMVNYKEFLQRLGVSVSQQARPTLDGAKGALSWPQQIPPSNSKIFKQRRDDEAALQKLSFDQIEIEFRRRIRTNFLNLKKVFLTFDPHLNGFVSLDDLKSVLSQFTLPMSDQLFTQLMERCGVRGTGKISWEQFLDKFSDPLGPGNGQTIPMRVNHKFFPIREGLHTVETDDIWKLLYKHVHAHYPSLKEAFLSFDVNRRGKVTRKELRNIIEKFTFRLDEQQFKQLMLKLDPHHTNCISYHDFLGIFEENDTAEGHKWLNSVHRFNEKQKPAVMAWETIEDILREKITENWKNVATALMDFDHKCEGKIPPAKLKSVIDKCVLPVSDSHFESMLQRCEDRTSNAVNYVEFLEKLNVDVKPGDLVGLSSQIQSGSDEREMVRLSNHFARSTRVNRRALARTENMSADEVIVRLKDRMSQHKVQIRQAFLSFDKSGRGRVSKRHFREVLGSFGMFMTDDQFQDLTNRLGFQNGFMQYSDFVTSFEDPRIQGPGEDIQRSGNHRVNPIRGDQFGMTADEVEVKLRSKLRENFANLRAAFYKFDDDHNGLINKQNFRRILDSFMCIMSDGQFEELCKRMGITKTTKISYEEFLHRFETRDTAEGHKWLNSVHRYNTTKPTPEITAESAHEILKEKVHGQWPDIAKAFINIDATGTKGVIRKKELRELLFRFTITLAPGEFQRLWNIFDEYGRGSVGHSEFLEKLGAAEFTPSDDFGTSSKIIDDSHHMIVAHNDVQTAKQERITKHQAERVAFMSAEDVERQLRDKIRDSYKDYYEAFRKYDVQKRGSLSVNEIQKVLNDLNFFLNDEEFFRLMERIGLGTVGRRLNYEEFLHAFEDGRKDHYRTKSTEVRVEEFQGLTPQEAETRLRDAVINQSEVLGKAFASFDKQQSNLIPMADFRRILDLFAFKLTDSQWRHIQSKLQMVDKSVNYVLFLENYTMSEYEDTEKWLANLQKQLRDQTPALMPIDEVQERLREAVISRFYVLAKILSDIDYAKIGVVSKEDFRDVLEKEVLRLTDEQFNRLWETLPTNEFWNLDYKDFLKRFSSNMEFPPSPRLQRPASTLNGRPASMLQNKRPPTRAMSRSLSQIEFGRQGSRMSRAQSRMSTPLVNAEFAESQLKTIIYRNWKDIQRQCRYCDRDNTGTIQVADLRGILDRYGVRMPEEDFYDLMTKYDLKENGSFAYVEFLRHFILNLKPQDDTNLLSRRKLPQSRLPTSAGNASNVFYSAMVRLRECVVQNWKEMRRTFRSVDPSNIGVVDSLEFRRILRGFNVNLEEEEFFHLMSYFDKNVDGKINYNDFIRAYLDQP